jgi:hypothetical protein
MTDYNDGCWHGWNGGECPVHPRSVVEVVFSKAGHRDGCKADTWVWDADQGTHTIVAFRVVKPYAEPVEYTGECSAYHFTEQTPMLCDLPPRDDIIAGRYTATYINGKLARIVWEAKE